jgi:hypothetical protein
MGEVASGSASPINRRKGWEADERPEPELVRAASFRT